MLAGNGASDGFSLEDVIALILAIETMVVDSTQAALLDAYRLEQRSVEEDLSLSQMHRVLEAFLIRWLVPDTEIFQEGQRNTSFPEHLLQDSSCGAVKTLRFGLLVRHDGIRMPPGTRWESVSSSPTLPVVATSFASWMEVHCQSEKADFAGMDTALTGRVHSADFYQSLIIESTE